MKKKLKTYEVFKSKQARIEECLLDLAYRIEQIEPRNSKRFSIYQKVAQNLFVNVKKSK